MAQHLIVPIDHSTESWRAFDVALALAARTDGDVRLVHVASDPVDGRQANTELRLELQRRGPFDVDVEIDVRLSIGTIASELESVLTLHPGAVLIMFSHGKGRSAGIIGSVTEDTLQRTFGPTILVGPHVEVNDFTGPVIVTVDGSQESEAALPLAAAWAIELDSTPCILNVADPAGTIVGTDNDIVDTGYSARLAQGLRSFSNRAVEFDGLHDRHPDRAVVDYAARHDASLIVASSHGRSGLSRVAMGSVTAGIVRHATCPVVVIRLPNLNPTYAAKREHMWAY